MWFGRLFCLFSLITLSGLDHALVQTYAWATMIQDRAPELGVSEAISDTFSGDHPCEICQALATVTEEEQEQAPAHESADQLAKLFSPLSKTTQLVFPPARDSWPHASATLLPSSVSHEMLTPPPEMA